MKRNITLFVVILMVFCMNKNIFAQVKEADMLGKWQMAVVNVSSDYPKQASQEMKKLQIEFGVWQNTIWHFQAESQYEILEKDTKGIYRFSGEKLYLELGEKELKGVPMASKDTISFTFSQGMSKVTFIFSKNIKKIKKKK